MSDTFGGQISKVIKITDAVTSRKVYLNQKGLSDVAALRRYYEDRIYEVRGEELQVSLPILIQWVMDDLIKLLKETRDIDVRYPEGIEEMGGE